MRSCHGRELRSGARTVSIPRELHRGAARGRRGSRRSVRPPTPTDRWCSSRRTTPSITSAARSWCRAPCWARAASIVGTCGTCGDGPSVARRYLALEGHRVLAELAQRLPLAAAVCRGRRPTSSAEESLDIAGGRTAIAAAPDWFGTIRPLDVDACTDARELRRRRRRPRADVRPRRRSRRRTTATRTTSRPRRAGSCRLFELPVGAQAPARFLRALFGSSRVPGRRRRRRRVGGRLDPARVDDRRGRTAVADPDRVHR